MQTKSNTNYIHDHGCILTHTHPSLNYGQTGTYFTDASSPKGYAWFQESIEGDTSPPAVLVKIKNIYTNKSTYVSGLESI